MACVHDRMGQDKEDSTKACRRCCCFTLLAVVGVVAVVLFVVLVILKPKKPEFSLQDVQVVAFRVDEPPPMSTSGFEVLLSMNLALTLAAHNPNKVGIRYSTMNVYIYYRNNPVGWAVVPTFYQPAHSRTFVKANLIVSRFNLLQGDASDLLRDATSGTVTLRVAGRVPAQVTILGVNTPRVQVSISCQIVVSPRQQQLVGKECGVKNVNF